MCLYYGCEETFNSQDELICHQYSHMNPVVDTATATADALRADAESHERPAEEDIRSYVYPSPDYGPELDLTQHTIQQTKLSWTVASLYRVLMMMPNDSRLAAWCEVSRLLRVQVWMEQHPVGRSKPP